VIAVAAFSAAVLLSVALVPFPSSTDTAPGAASPAHPISLEQAAESGVPVQLSLAVAPGQVHEERFPQWFFVTFCAQVLEPGQAVSARVGPYVFNGIVAGQQPSLQYSQPLLQAPYSFAQQQQPYAYAQQPYAYAQPQMLQQPVYEPVLQPYAQPVNTGMPGFQLVDIQPQVRHTLFPQ
jgi:hypothetical protein